MKKDARKKIAKFTEKETLTQVFSCEFLEILNNSFIYRTPLGDSFCYSLSFRVWIGVFVIFSKSWSQLNIHASR